MIVIVYRSLVQQKKCQTLSAEYEAEQKKLTEKVQIIWNFVGKLKQVADKQTIERQRKGRTA